MRAIYNENSRVLTIYDGRHLLREFQIDDRHDIDIPLSYNMHEYFTFDEEDLTVYHYMHGSFPAEIPVKIT